MATTDEYQPRTADRLIEILRATDPNPRSWQAEAASEIERLRAALTSIWTMNSGGELAYIARCQQIAGNALSPATQN